MSYSILEQRILLSLSLFCYIIALLHLNLLSMSFQWREADPLFRELVPVLLHNPTVMLQLTLSSPLHICPRKNPPVYFSLSWSLQEGSTDPCFCNKIICSSTLTESYNGLPVLASSPVEWPECNSWYKKSHTAFRFSCYIPWFSSFLLWLSMKATIFDLSNAVDRKIQRNSLEHISIRRGTQFILVNGMTDKKLHTVYT